MRTYVISGATGMIGRALCAEILGRGDAVIALCRPGSSRAENLPKSERLTICMCGLSDMKNYSPESTADAFLHLAWEKTVGMGRDDADAQWQNVQYTLDAVRLAKRFGCSAFLGAGSQAEYGISNEPLRPDSPTDPQSGYGVAKFAAGKLSRLLAEQLGIRHNWARILSVYGCHDANRTLISYLIDTISKGIAPELTPCEQTWDYLYATDAARALLAIADRGVQGRVYPVGSGEARPLADYVRELRDCINPCVEPLFGKKTYYPHQPMFLVADITALTTDTGFIPRVTFKEGIKKILATENEA